MQMIHFGNLRDASALDIVFDPIFDFAPYFNKVQTFNDPVIMNTPNVLQANQLTFNAAFSGGALGSAINTTSGVNFSNVSLAGPLAVAGNMSFNPSSLVSLGYVTPTPHPPKDEMLTMLTSIGITDFASLVSLGYVTPTPHPPKDEMIGWDGWAPNPIFVNGKLDLTGVIINVDSLVDVNNMPYFDNFISLFGATQGITGTPTLTGALADRFVYFDPTFYNVDGTVRFETGGLRAVPEPSTVLLLGTGLFGLAFVAIRRQKKTTAK